MIQRGRKAGASKTPAGAKLALVEFGLKAPPPPDDLTLDEVAIWEATVATEDPSFVSSGAQRAMLVDYCRHRAAGDKISRVINMFQDEWLKNGDAVKRYKLLLASRENETRAAADKATKLRLTNQSRYTPQTAGRMGRDAPKGGMPWDE